MPLSTKQSNFIYFLSQKYNKDSKDNLTVYSDNKTSSKKNNFKKALSKFEDIKNTKHSKNDDPKDLDDKATLEWNKNYNNHFHEINILTKKIEGIFENNNEIINKNKDFKKIEERNNKIIVNFSILSTTVVLSLFALVFFPKPTLTTTDFLDSLLLYPFNKLENAYNFNYNQGVFHVARIDRKINQKMKIQYIKNINKNLLRNNKLSIKLPPTPQKPQSPPVNNIIVMGIDNSDLINKNKNNFFKEILKKITNKQIEISNELSKKLIDLIN